MLKAGFECILLYMRKRYFSVIIEKDKHGYAVTCPAIQGCYSQGDTYEEAMSNIKDAIRLCLEDITSSEEKTLIVNPSLLSLAAVEVPA